MQNKSSAVLEKLNKIAENSINAKKYNKALAAIAAAADILYAHNQVYTDEKLESMLKSIGSELFDTPNWDNTAKKETSKTVLFYDGFGLDTRGLALIFLKGLVRCGYKVVYVTPDYAEGKQPEIKKVLNGYDAEWIHFPAKKGFVAWAKAIIEVFEKYHPDSAFFYTIPSDVAATIVFNLYEGYTKRFQIDLTDHAFWLGKYAFDYCIALRDVGSKIAVNHRKIPKEKIVMLPYYANIDYDIEFEGFTFPTQEKRIIFSGGSLYKTLGDEDNTYYKIVDSILEKHADIIFLYAGFGDDSQLKLIIDKYPDRAYHIAERKDLFQVMKRCVLYLNTYPMFGGLMMNFAASAGKLPLTLKHNNDADGLLFNQSNLQIEYDTKEELLNDVDKLLNDSAYLRERESKLSGSVITQERFEKNLKMLIETNTTEFPIYTEEIDTTQFRKEFDARFSLKKELKRAVVASCRRPLTVNFPIIYAAHYFRRVFEKIVDKIRRK